MKEAMDEARIFSTLEVKLSMQILGVEAWDYFPVLEEEDPLEKRVMTAFLRLVEMGFMEGKDGGYRKTEQMEESFAEAKHPEFTMQILKKDGMPVVVTGNRDRVIVLEQLTVQDGTVRVYHTEPERVWKYLEILPENISGRKSFAELSTEKKMMDADVVIRLRKKERENMLYIWETGQGKVYLQEQETKAKELNKEDFLQLLEE